jgi:cytochrome b subunit of formate dehydrogenase
MRRENQCSVRFYRQVHIYKMHWFAGNIPAAMEVCTDDHSARIEHAASEERMIAVDK